MAIKNWIINQVTPMGWSMMISRALPELLEVNPDFSLIRINRSTYWDEDEVVVIQEYLNRIYGLRIPSQVLQDVEELSDRAQLLESNYFSFNTLVSDMRDRTKRFFRKLVI